MKNVDKEEKIKKAVETTGKTVEKALEKALKILGKKVNEVDIEILDPGQKGVLNFFGSREARIKVTRKKGSKGIEEIADEVTQAIMDGLEISYRLFCDENDDSTYINIETAGVDGLLIGRKGDTLNSLQHLVGRIVSRRMGGYQRLTLDVGGYLKNRHEILVQKAEKAAERAKQTNREVSLEPMKAAERRIIHLALADRDEINTYTVGNGEMRKVFVSPVRGREKRPRHNGRR
ncbi:MAG: Jag N-terminal domain-containing protein [Candidatus Krumholzibacteriota bacterium]|nr:Jag N-terminal domain-containing protein [Candidatus Krumholzibacteriota bacterium]